MLPCEPLRIILPKKRKIIRFKKGSSGKKEGGGGFRGNVSTGIQRRVSEKGESRNKRVCCSLSGSVYYPKAVQREKAKGIKGDRKNERTEEKGSPLYFHGRLDGR